MPINIKSQKDSLTTDVVIDLPTNLNEIDQLMRSSKATGRVVATYNQGGLLGVNVEQKQHISDQHSGKVRDIIGVGTRELEVK